MKETEVSISMCAALEILKFILKKYSNCGGEILFYSWNKYASS